MVLPGEFFVAGVDLGMGRECGFGRTGSILSVGHALPPSFVNAPYHLPAGAARDSARLTFFPAFSFRVPLPSPGRDATKPARLPAGSGSSSRERPRLETRGGCRGRARRYSNAEPRGLRM